MAYYMSSLYLIPLVWNIFLFWFKMSKCVKVAVIFCFNSTLDSGIDYLDKDYFNLMPKNGQLSPQENQLNKTWPRIKKKIFFHYWRHFGAN